MISEDLIREVLAQEAGKVVKPGAEMWDHIVASLQRPALVGPLHPARGRRNRQVAAAGHGGDLNWAGAVLAARAAVIERSRWALMYGQTAALFALMTV